MNNNTRDLPASYEGQESRLYSLQVLRAIAAGMVIYSHVSNYWRTPGFHWTQFGIDIFFVISGYIMLRLRRDAGNGATAALTFLIKRFTRLLPLYWLLTSLAVVFFICKGEQQDWSLIVLSYLLIPELHPATPPVIGLAWSLIYEVTFYVMVAGAITLSLGRRSSFAFLMLVMAALLGANAITDGVYPVLAEYGRPMILEFLIGAAIGTWEERLFRWVHPVFLPAMAAAGLWLAQWMSTHDTPPWMVGAFLLVLATLRAERLVAWPRWLVKIGDASYALYLSHPGVMAVLAAVYPSLRSVLPGPAAAVAYLAVFCPAAVALSLLLHRQIERRAQRWLNQILLKPRPPRASVRQSPAVP